MNYVGLDGIEPIIPDYNDDQLNNRGVNPDLPEYRLVVAIIKQALEEDGYSYTKTEDYEFYCGLLGVDPEQFTLIMVEQDLI